MIWTCRVPQAGPPFSPFAQTGFSTRRFVMTSAAQGREGRKKERAGIGDHVAKATDRRTGKTRPEPALPSLPPSVRPPPRLLPRPPPAPACSAAATTALATYVHVVPHPFPHTQDTAARGERRRRPRLAVERRGGRECFEFHLALVWVAAAGGASKGTHSEEGEEGEGRGRHQAALRTTYRLCMQRSIRRRWKDGSSAPTFRLSFAH